MADNPEQREWERQFRHRQACQIVGVLPEKFEEAMAVLRLATALLQAANVGVEAAGAMEDARPEALQ